MVTVIFQLNAEPLIIINVRIPYVCHYRQNCRNVSDDCNDDDDDDKLLTRGSSLLPFGNVGLEWCQDKKSGAAFVSTTENISVLLTCRAPAY